MKRALRFFSPLLAAALTVADAPARAEGLKYVTSFGSSGSGSGQFKGPLGVVVSEGMAYDTDEINQRIDVFEPANFATSFTSFGSFGSGPGSSSPRPPWQ
jgi:hypothetical protein